MDEQLAKIWQQLGLLADNQAKSVTAHAQAAQGQMRIADTMERILMTLALHQAALVALASTHPAKNEARESLQHLWNERRGPLGVDNASDHTRQAVQGYLDDLARALGGKII